MVDLNIAPAGLSSEVQQFLSNVNTGAKYTAYLPGIGNAALCADNCWLAGKAAMDMQVAINPVSKCLYGIGCGFGVVGTIAAGTAVATTCKKEIIIIFYMWLQLTSGTGTKPAKNFGIELSSQEVPLKVLSSVYNVSQLSSRWISVVPLSTLKTPKQK